jgi:hypothetical protein
MFPNEGKAFLGPLRKPQQAVNRLRRSRSRFLPFQNLSGKFYEQGGHRREQPPSRPFERSHKKLLAYSLKTKTRVCPEKRTSFTWPSSPISTELFAALVLRSSQRPSLSTMVCRPFWMVALFPSIIRRYSPACRSALPIFADWAMLMVLANGFARSGTVEAKAAASARLRRIEWDFMRVNFLSVRIESAAFLLPQAEQS